VALNAQAGRGPTPEAGAALKALAEVCPKVRPLVSVWDSSDSWRARVLREALLAAMEDVS
jgi:hypothetical protein